MNVAELLTTGVPVGRQVGESKGRIDVTNEPFARVKIDQLLKDCPASAPMRQIRRVEEGRISGSS
jgi:hypothetical protein